MPRVHYRSGNRRHPLRQRMSTRLAFAPVKVAPGAAKPSLVGFMRAMVRNPVAAVPPAAYREPITLLKMSGTTMAFVSDPDLLEEILVRRVADFPKSQVDDRVLRP